MFPTVGRPSDERRFIHKKLLGGFSKIAGILPIPAPVASLVGGLAGRFAGTARPTVPRTRTARVTAFSQEEKEAGARLKFPGFGGGGGGLIGIGRSVGRGGTRSGGRTPCDFPMEIAPDGSCREPTVDRFGRPLGVGEAVMGRYGAALEPGSRMIDRAICLRGMQLGNDGLCYNKGQITNKQRMWPAGRKPLLTGGDMRAISTAARAGRRMDLATKRLQKLGMMKKPAARRAGPHKHARAATDVVSV